MQMRSRYDLIPTTNASKDGVNVVFKVVYRRLIELCMAFKSDK